MSLVEDSSNRFLLGLRLSKDHLHFLFSQPGRSRRSRVTFKDVRLDDNRWHTLSLGVAGQYVTLTVDCGLPVEM